MPCSFSTVKQMFEYIPLGLTKYIDHIEYTIPMSQFDLEKNAAIPDSNAWESHKTEQSSVTA